MPITASRNLGMCLLVPIGGRLRLDQRGEERERVRERERCATRRKLVGAHMAQTCSTCSVKRAKPTDERERPLLRDAWVAVVCARRPCVGCLSSAPPTRPGGRVLCQCWGGLPERACACAGACAWVWLRAVMAPSAGLLFPHAISTYLSGATSADHCLTEPGHVLARAHWREAAVGSARRGERESEREGEVRHAAQTCWRAYGANLQHLQRETRETD